MDLFETKTDETETVWQRIEEWLADEVLRRVDVALADREQQWGVLVPATERPRIVSWLEERAAIHEHVGDSPKHEAEIMAAADTMGEFLMPVFLTWCRANITSDWGRRVAVELLPGDGTDTKPKPA